MTTGTDAASAFVTALVAGLSDMSDPDRAASEQRYLKLARPFYGVGVPACRQLTKRLLVEHGVDSHEAVVAVVDRCWQQTHFECRRCAVEVLTARRRVLGVDDLEWIGPMLRGAETWALLDELAVRAVGSIVERYPVESGPVLDRWAADPRSFWVRRSALLALLVPLREGGGDWERFTRYADAMMGEREFFIRKAIGWVLRDVSRRRPELVRAYVEPRLDEMSGVTRREAVKYL